ncbi:MAG: ATP-binding protein [Rhodospirillales bacterium]
MAETPSFNARAETAAAERDAILAICDMAPAAFCVVDAADRVVFANRRFAEAAGVDRARAAHTRRALSDALMQAEDGSHTWARSGAPVRVIEGGRVALGVGGLGRVLMVLPEETPAPASPPQSPQSPQSPQAAQTGDQAQKLQAVGQLAGGVAHDFNNLLTAIIGFTEMLLQRHGPEDPSNADLMQILQSANRATNLVRQLLAFSRKQTLAPVDFDPVQALNEISSLLTRLLGETVKLNVAPKGEMGWVRADRGQFDQVIMNLAVNARDAMPRGGLLAVRARRETLVQPMERMGETVPAGAYVVIDVADEGEGIAPENLERIFEPFFSTKEVGQGTGLGLSTVHGIVRQSDGFIFVESAAGQGTTFSIWLPEREAPRSESVLPAPAPASASAEPEKTPRAPVTASAEPDLSGDAVVLLVEDEDAVRMVGARALKNRGYDVIEARDAERAMEIIERSLIGDEKTIHIIVSDVVMPGMDGPALVRKARMKAPRLKAILMSGYAEDAFPDDFKNASGVHFLGKPFTPKTLALKVKEVLEEV